MLNCYRRSGEKFDLERLTDYRIELSPLPVDEEEGNLTPTPEQGNFNEGDLKPKSIEPLLLTGEEKRDDDEIIYIEPREREALVRCWESYPGRAWINGYLDLVKELLDRAGLDNDDERLVMSIREIMTLPVTINQRYVIRCAPPGRVGLIMPLAYDPAASKEREHILYDDYFYRSTVKDARWVVFDRGKGVRLSPEIKDFWMEAVFRELEAGIRSGFRKYHRPIFYKAVQDMKWREILLNDAFD